MVSFTNLKGSRESTPLYSSRQQATYNDMVRLRASSNLNKNQRHSNKFAVRLNQYEINRIDGLKHNINHNSKKALHDLQVLRSENLNLGFVPRKTSTTCKGSPILKPIFNPVPFSEEDYELHKIKSIPVPYRRARKGSKKINHQFDHICQNILMAGSTQIHNELHR